MKTTVSVSIIMMMLAAGFIIISYDRSDNGIKLMSDDDYEDMKYETNYRGLLILGLVPSTYSRQPQENDIDTGIKLTDGDNIYSLIESRTWHTKDYGKTFVVKIN